jgi:alginate O-acetyltransferase complex protein AlgJ
MKNSNIIDRLHQRNLILTVFFLLSTGVIPVAQTILDSRPFFVRDRMQPVQCPELVALPQTFNDSINKPNATLFKRIGNACDDLLKLIHDIEHGLEETSFLRPVMVKLLAPLYHRLGLGSENALIGRNGWLYYQPDVACLTNPVSELADSIETVVDFNRQLAARGISLLVMPTPIKPSIEPEFLWKGYAGRNEPLLPPAYAAWLQALGHRGIRVFDSHPVLMKRKSGTHESPYLKTDTHWTPRAMEAIASALADEIRPDFDEGSAVLERQGRTVSSPGDIALMLNPGNSSVGYPLETVEINEMRIPGHGIWRESKSADVLLLGDSFSNIYSLEGMGWGRSAGLAEQLSYYLQRPIDRIVQNDAGASAGRRILSQELARGKDRLAGKKLVIWQFAVRELSFGDWQPIELKLNDSPADMPFIAPDSGKNWTVSGVIESISAIPLPGSVPYPDHIASVHLSDIRSGNPSLNFKQAMVYMQSMKDNQWTAAARLRTGDRVCIQLSAWVDIEDRMGGINRSEPEDGALLLAEPCWGELIHE